MRGGYLLFLSTKLPTPYLILGKTGFQRVRTVESRDRKGFYSLKNSSEAGL